MPKQREFQAVTMEYLAAGVGLPAFSYADKPALPGDGFAPSNGGNAAFIQFCRR